MRSEDERRTTIDFPNDQDVLIRRKDYERNYNPKKHTQYELLFFIKFHVISPFKFVRFKPLLSVFLFLSNYTKKIVVIFN